MKLEKVINETLTSIWSPKQYQATSMAPRKDFAPLNTQDGYNYPYQTQSPLPTPDVPSNKTANIPWPLQTIDDDLADSYVYLLAAGQKIQTAIKNNPSLSKQQKLKMKVLLKNCKSALNLIKKIGFNIKPIIDLNQK
jgi:hypothetical protein